MLLTKELRGTLPELYSQEGESNPLVRVKFFLPSSKWTWYGIEFDGEDLFFGYVDGEYPELGYFRLSELQEIRGLWNLGVERDMYFHPTPLHTIQAEVERRGE